MVFKPGVSGNPGGRWKPGQSGNPGGRPKSRPFKEALDRILKAHGDGSVEGGLDKLAAAMVAKAQTGDVAAAKEIMDRYEGKVPTPIGGTDELPSIKGFAWIDPTKDDEQPQPEATEPESKEPH
ncbi:MAG TPA: DUF5681 domain-containing protein [Candidatus Paceibacterota bacterium]